MKFCENCTNFLYLNEGKRCPKGTLPRLLDKNDAGCSNFNPKKSSQFQGFFGGVKRTSANPACGCSGDCGDGCECNPGSGGCGNKKQTGCGGGCGGCGN